MIHSEHTLVQLANGEWSLRCTEVSETYHPVIGPESEANTLYAQQIHIERMELNHTPFVVWDVGLGGAANALAVIRAASIYKGHLVLYSFDYNLEPLTLALANPDKLPYIQPFISIVQELLEKRHICFSQGYASIEWNIIYGDFPSWLRNSVDSDKPIPSPNAILYDAFSPKKNPDMYTLDLFTQLRNRLESNTPCLLASYSRATLLRSTLLLAGFYVGKGAATGEKEETTVAANTPDLVQSPLDHRWLERAHRSNSAEPLHSSEYTQQPLSEKSWNQLLQHPQFQNIPNATTSTLP